MTAATAAAAPAVGRTGRGVEGGDGEAVLVEGGLRLDGCRRNAVAVHATAETTAKDDASGEWAASKERATIRRHARRGRRRRLPHTVPQQGPEAHESIVARSGHQSVVACDDNGADAPVVRALDAGQHAARGDLRP